MNETRTVAVDSAAEALLRILADRGVDYIFGNSGTDFPSIIEGLAKLSESGEATPKPITVPHENLAVSMAYGFYLATGRPQAVMLHVNVGTANALCALLNAARANVPILLAAGRTPITEGGEFGSRTGFIHWGQEMFDQGGMLREIVKWDYELRSASQVEAVVDRALSIAMSAPRGPVYLTMPREVLARGKGSVSLAPASRHCAAAAAAPNPEAVAQAAEWLAAAENPLIVTANYGLQRREVDVLETFTERHAIPAVGYKPRYLFLPSQHPMHAGYEPAPFLPAADVILVLDCDVPWIPELHRVNPDAKVIHVGADPLFSRYPMRSFRCDLAIAAAPDATIEALDRAVSGSGGRNPERIEARRERVARRQADRKAGSTRGGSAASGPLTPAAVSAAIARLKRPEDIFVNETSALPLDPIDFSEPGTYFGTSPGGGLGWGLGTALGLKLAQPGRRVITAVGDGTYMFCNPTPAHYVSAAVSLPTLTVILNNRMWGAVRRATLSLYPDGVAARASRPPLTWLDPSPDYERIVEASGGYGEKVEDGADLDGAFQRALHAVDTEKRQAVLNIRLSYSDADALRDTRPRPG